MDNLYSDGVYLRLASYPLTKYKNGSYNVCMKKKLRVGNKLIESGMVYRIFKIEEIEFNGKSDRIIHYKPLFNNSFNDSLVCSVPESNLEESNVRLPIPKDEMIVVIKNLSRKRKRRDLLDINEAKDILKLNDIYKTADLLNRYWKEMQKFSENFTKKQRDVIDMAIERLTQQVAIVYHVSLTSAEKKLISALEK